MAAFLAIFNFNTFLWLKHNHMENPKYDAYFQELGKLSKVNLQTTNSEY